MAILKNMWLKGASKKLGGVVLYEAMGQTRSRELTSSVANPRTEAQMTQRIKWSNLVNFYRANQSWMRYAFETKKTNQSEYNKFMSLNVTGSPVALTKDAASAGACVAYPYIITQGSLPSIEWYDSENALVSNIYFPDAFRLSDSTTVAAFSRAMITSNPAIREGDQLSFIRVSQLYNSATSYPYIVVRKYEMIVSSTSQNLVTNYIPVDLIQVDGTADNNALQVLKANRQGGFAVILSRTISGKTYVSTQRLIMVNNTTTIAVWSNSAAVAAAIASYGESSDAFLSATSANQAQSLPVPLSIVSVTMLGVPYPPGATTPVANAMGNKQFSIQFSDTLATPADVDDIFFHLLGGADLEPNERTVVGSQINGTLDNPIEADSQKHIGSVSVWYGGQEYTINFAPASSYTSQGLE